MDANVEHASDGTTEQERREKSRDDVASQPPPSVPFSGCTLSPELIARLNLRLAKARDVHDQWIDAFCFNGGTLGVLLLTAAATFIPSLDGAPKWLAPLCSGIAGFWIAAERALGFGARWRYHREMKSGYEAIIDMLDFYQGLPPAEQSKYARDIFTALYALRSRESAMPNVGSASQPT